MRQLIEKVSQENIVECDNKECDFVVPNGKLSYKLVDYINVPCPNCGDNLLTLEDYKLSVSMDNVVKWMNKWFSWTTIFTRNKNYKNVSVKVHDGITIEKEK